MNVNKATASSCVSGNEKDKYLIGVVAGAGGFEPPYGGIKIRCLTTWRRPNIVPCIMPGCLLCNLFENIVSFAKHFAIWQSNLPLAKSQAPIVHADPQRRHRRPRSTPQGAALVVLLDLRPPSLARPSQDPSAQSPVLRQ